MNFIHFELTSRCNKRCSMCGRRKMEREHPDLCNWGDMPFEMVRNIADQVPAGVVVQFHNNGEPTLYPHLGQAVALFHRNIKQFNTNGKLLLEKADEIIGNLDVLTLSVIENDPEGEEQYGIARKFIEIKGDRRPRMVYRLLGNVKNADRWDEMPGIVARRTLHAPDGSRDYRKPVVVPEIGVCLDLLTHLAIDRNGWISVCVRFDPHGDLRLGNINVLPLEDAWNGKKRRNYIENHVKGRRADCPGCDRCHFYGVPIG